MARDLGLTTPTPAELDGWTPIRLAWTGAEPVVEWCNTDGEHFEDPFFDQTVMRCLRHPFRLLFRYQTPMSTLGEVAATGDTLPLAGLVFHSSRCGSTLVSQMLAGLPSVQVMAEPAPLHSVLAAWAAHPEVTEEQGLDWLRWTVAALGQRRRPEQRHLVVKLDAWAVLHLPFIRKAFPETPWIFLYREPIEVLVSHFGHRGYHMIPGCLPAALLGLEPGEAARLPPADYMARVLGSLMAAAAPPAGGGRSILVNYRELPDAVASRVAPWFGIDLGRDERTGMADAANRDAKNPSIPFAADSAIKQGRATEEVRTAAQRWVRPRYEALEAYRAGSP